MPWPRRGILGMRHEVVTLAEQTDLLEAFDDVSAKLAEPLGETRTAAANLAGVPRRPPGP